jgi:hypothetical protein
MNNQLNALFTGAVIFLATTSGYAQETVTKDPILKYSGLYEVNFSASMVRVNTNHTVFNTDNGTFSFVKNNYLPAFEGGFSYSWLFADSEEDIWSLKTGVQLMNRNANLTDSLGTGLKLSTGYIQVPIMVGMRMPLQHHRIRDGYFRAIELHVGPYVSTPFYQKLDNRDNIDQEGDLTAFNYLRFGFVSEISYTSLNERGNGHKFGLRVSSDITEMAVLNDTDAQLYPYYYSIGIFYNFINLYR